MEEAATRVEPATQNVTDQTQDATQVEEEMIKTTDVGLKIGMDLLNHQYRGAGESIKEKWICGLKTSHSVHFISIQTKMCSIERFRVSQFWGRSLFEFDSVDSVGRSGGILSIWDPSFFERTRVIKHRRFLVVSGVIISPEQTVNVVNIYASNDAVDRRRLWHMLLCITGVLPGLWVLAGDFNEVCVPFERRNSELCASNAVAFNAFIERAGLVEYQMEGGLFTYISDHGDKFSKLDRVLVCREYMNEWP